MTKGGGINFGRKRAASGKTQFMNERERLMIILILTESPVTVFVKLLHTRYLRTGVSHTHTYTQPDSLQIERDKCDKSEWWAMGNLG